MILLLWISVCIMYTKVTILQNVPNNCSNSFGSCSGVRLLIFKCQIYFISIYCFCISLTQFATNIIKFPFEVASVLNEQTLEENFKIVPIIIKLSKLKHFQRHNGPEGWVLLTKAQTSSNTNLDQISSSEFQPSTNFKISSKHQHHE